MDLGNPTSYLQLAEGVPVYASDGTEVGRVQHVLADADADVFDGLVVDTRRGPGGHRFVDAPEVDRLFERGVTLSIDAAAVQRLPEPTDNPAVMQGGDLTGSDRRGRLRRALDALSGRRR